MLPAGDIGRPLMQGCSALAAPKLGSDEDRRLIMIRDFFLLQLPSFADFRVSSPRRRQERTAMLSKDAFVDFILERAAAKTAVVERWRGAFRAPGRIRRVRHREVPSTLPPTTRHSLDVCSKPPISVCPSSWRATASSAAPTPWRGICQTVSLTGRRRLQDRIRRFFSNLL